MRSSIDIKNEIVSRFGFFPPFFEPALSTPQVLENLWQQTLSAYLENPLPPLFKEKLNAYLSRYCVVPYCMVCHSASLRPLGMAATEVLTLLESPPPMAGNIEQHLTALATQSDPQTAFLTPGSSQELSLIACTAAVFLEGEQARRCRRELSRVLGADLYNSLSVYLGYIKTSHTWMEMHPEVSYETDRRAQDNLAPMLAEEPALAEFFRTYRQRVAQELQSRAEQAAVRESEERFRAAFAHAAVGMALTDLRGRFLLVNPAYCAITGHTERELLSLGFSEIAHPDDRAAKNAQIERMLAGDIPSFVIEKRYIRKDGRIVWVKNSVSLMRDAEGLPVNIIALTEDITERIQATEGLREANQRTVNILESITGAFFALDSVWRFTYVNEQAERHLRRSREELLGKNIWEEFPEIVGSTFDRQSHHAAAERVAVTFEEHYAPLSTWFEVHAYPSLTGLSVHFHDISDRKTAEDARDQAEQTLRVSEERYRLLVEGARDYAMVMLDAQGNVVHTNPGAERILGFAEGELLGQPIAVIFTSEDRERGVPERERENAVRDGRAEDRRWHQKQDGTRFWADGVITSLHDTGGLRGFAKVMRDATESKRVEDALRASEARFRQMADAIPHIAWTTQADGSVDSYNQRWYDYSGLTFEETRDWGWAHVIHPDDLQAAASTWIAALGAGTVSEVEYRLKRADGEYRWHLGRSEPVHDETGQIIKWVGTATDITERKEAEQTQAALLQHEHNIADQLQQALQPEAPRTAPGLALAKYYESALPEAGVGGDFYDVFTIERDVTFLVVGDLSGKGLAAAAQVATVRNMLRFALCNGRTLAGPVTSLNRTLAENNLLTGFATLFVGRFDSRARTLAYVNCGQEPALIRRAAAGRVEELPPTGMVLGTVAAAAFTEQEIALSAGDSLSIFTDGLTEAGPNRREMLGIEGVTALLEQTPIKGGGQSAEDLAESLMLRLISGVDTYAEQGIRDDVCLLVAVVQ